MSRLRQSGSTLLALSLFVILNLGFLTFGFDRVFRATVRRAISKGGPSGARPWDREVIVRAAVAVQRATFLYYRRRKDCLPRSLALFYLLRSRGVPAVIHIGVAKYPFQAHAWVEVEGRPVEPLRPEHTGLRVLLSA
jgi:Transglutaminase-like superfamily